jgi:hypothetical protein
MAKGWNGVQPVSNRLDSREWIFACPKPNCYYAVSAATQELAKEREATHDCPYGGEIKFGESVTMMLIEQLWAEGDKYYAKMESEPDRFRGVVNGICISIAVFMQPYFKTPADVAKELTKRRAHAQANEPYETLGLGKLHYAAPTAPPAPLTRVREGEIVRYLRTGEIGEVKSIADDGGITLALKGKNNNKEFTSGLSMHELAPVSNAEIAKADAKSTRVAAAKPIREFSDREIDGIRFAHKSGSFTIEQIANTYRATVKEIKTLLGVA